MKRKDYISRDEYFMGVALLSAQRSKDPSTQVGACIVSPDKKIVGIGYNGFPIGISDDALPRTDDDTENLLNNKHAYAVHAEANAILNANRNSLEWSRIYLSLFPCNECAKLLIQSGIKEIIYWKKKGNKDYERASEKMLKLAGVKMRKYTGNIDIHIQYHH